MLQRFQNCLSQTLVTPLTTYPNSVYQNRILSSRNLYITSDVGHLQFSKMENFRKGINNDLLKYVNVIKNKRKKNENAFVDERQ